jgi:predicted ester cyclase
MTNKGTLEQSLAHFAHPDKRQEYFRLYSDDIVLHGYPGIEPGLENVKQFYYAFWKVFPDARVILQELVGEGDTLVARYVILGTQHEPFMGVAADGQQIELPGISVLHFRNGRCFERWTCSDSLVLLSQIRGVVRDAT